MEVKLITKKILMPVCASPSNVVELSNIDQFVFPIHVPSLLFFPYDGSPDFMNSKLLEISLTQTLSAFYPFAGRLKRDESTGRVHVECNDQGVAFLEASATGQLADLKDRFPCKEYALLDPCQTYSKPLPLVLIQITRFECNGVALTVAINHQVCDAQTYIFFMQMWTGRTMGHEPQEQPFFNHPKLQSSVRRSGAASTVPPNQFTSPPTPRCKPKLFLISSEKIECLKRRISPPPTRFEALAGHIWRSITKARCLNPSQETKIILAVDARRRFDPPLPPGTFGNVVLHPCASASVGELLDVPETAPRKIHDAVHSVDANAVRQALEMESFMPPGFDGYSSDIFFSTWSSGNNPMGTLDFGWGKATSVRMACIDECPGPAMVYFFPESESVGVFIRGITPEEILKLEEDPEFM